MYCKFLLTLGLELKNLFYFTILPIATETLGSWGPMGLKFVREIGGRIAEATGEKKSRYYLLQAISMAIQRGNVSSILGNKGR